MDSFEKIELDLLDELKKEFPSKSDYQITDVEKFTGADTETFGFRLVSDERKIGMILRLFRTTTDRALNEFRTLKSLHDAGISVPKPYFTRKTSRSVSRSYLVMEKISGVILADHFFQISSKQLQMELFSLYIQEMVNLHSYDWRSSFTDLIIPDLKKDPYYYVDKVLSHPKDLIEIYNVVELKPLVKWLEDNKEKSELSSLIHGDFHMNNVMITPEKSLVVLDWSNIRISDFRLDLGFSIVATSSVGTDVKKDFSRLYESLSGRKVNNIEFFMVLSILHNLLRIYSSLTDHGITNESETTKNIFLVNYKSYTQYLVKIVNKITGIELPTLEKALN